MSATQIVQYFSTATGGISKIMLEEEMSDIEEERFISTPEFITAAERTRISPWRSFLDFDEFKIEREALGDIEVQDALRLIERYGICHLRLCGIPADEDTLRSFFESIGQVMNVQNHFEGEIKNIKPEPDMVANTGNSAGDLGFHVDGTQHEHQPALLVFQYIVTADLGGNSRFVDIADILAELSEATRDRIIINLSQRDTAVFEKNEMRLTSPIFYIPDGETVACRIRIDDVISVKESCQEDFEILKNLLQEPKYGIKFKPRPGDIIIFDNWRVLHARDAVLGNRQRHHRRVWIEALLPRYQRSHNLGIRPVSSSVKAEITKNSSS